MSRSLFSCSCSRSRCCVCGRALRSCSVSPALVCGVFPSLSTAGGAPKSGAEGRHSLHTAQRIAALVDCEPSSFQFLLWCFEQPATLVRVVDRDRGPSAETSVAKRTWWDITVAFQRGVGFGHWSVVVVFHWAHAPSLFHRALDLLSFFF